MSDPDTTSSRARLLLLLFCAAGLALPSLTVTIPPVTDLPQHIGQARLLLETLRDPGGPYMVQPLTPYWGAHVLILPLWLALPARWVATAAVALLGVAWALAVHALAWRRGRSAEAAVLACLLFFNQSLYWGFIPFLVGWLVYLSWLLLIQDARGPAWRVVALHLAGAALLYACHALWFAMGMLTLALHWAVRRPGWRAVLLQGAAVTPVGLLALWWYPQLARRGFSSPTYYLRSFAERFSPQGLTASAFGGLRDSVEGPVLLSLLVWLGVGLWQHRRELRAQVDGALLAPGLLMLACVLVLPDKFSNTIGMAERWMPCALVLLLLALPSPRLPARARRAWVAASLLLLSGFTAMTWRAFERQELSGLEAAVDAVPEGARVVGLAYVKQSPLVRGRPFLQAFSYAYALRGAPLNFSFAWFAPSPVVLRRLRAPPWTVGLEWEAQAVRPDRDFRFFDYALVALPEEEHPRFEAAMPLEAVTHEGVWRLYRITPPPAAGDTAPVAPREGSP